MKMQAEFEVEEFVKSKGLYYDLQQHKLTTVIVNGSETKRFRIIDKFKS